MKNGDNCAFSQGSSGHSAGFYTNLELPVCVDF